MSDQKAPRKLLVLNEQVGIQVSRRYISIAAICLQGCGVGIRVGRNCRWSWSWQKCTDCDYDSDISLKS
jgi:hypothetical protein